MPGTNALVHCENSQLAAVKSFITSGSCGIIKNSYDNLKIILKIGVSRLEKDHLKSYNSAYDKASLTEKWLLDNPKKFWKISACNQDEIKLNFLYLWNR